MFKLLLAFTLVTMSGVAASAQVNNNGLAINTGALITGGIYQNFGSSGIVLTSSLTASIGTSTLNNVDSNGNPIGPVNAEGNQLFGFTYNGNPVVGSTLVYSFITAGNGDIVLKVMTCPPPAEVV